MRPAVRHWSIDFVQHLRAVHFTLLAVAISLAVLATAPRTDVQAKTALPSIMQFSKARDAWPKDWVEQFRPNGMKDTIPMQETLSFYLPLDHPPPDRLSNKPGQMYYLDGFPYIGSELQTQTKGLQKIDVTLKAPAHLWTAERTVDYQGHTTILAESPSSLKAETAPATLKEFHDWWDNARSTRVAFFTVWGDDNYISVKDFRGGFINPRKTVCGGCKHFAPDENTQTVNLKIETVTLPFVTLARAYVGDVLLPDGHPGRLSLRAFGGGSFDVQPWRVLKFAEERCAAAKPEDNCGPFNSLFPELMDVESDLGDVPLDKLIDEAVRRASSPEPVSLLGIKFPLRAVTRWGIVLLLLIQLYLWLHMHEMSGKIERGDAPGLDVAWIGVYTSRISRLAFLLSLLVPSFVVLLLAYYLPAEARTRILVGALAGGLSMLLGATSRPKDLFAQTNAAPAPPASPPLNPP